MKGKLLRKLCAVSLSALMVGGAGLAEVGSFAFASLSVSAAETTEATPESSFVYEVNYWYDSTVRITEFNGTETDVVIPSTIDGKRVTRIGDEAFSACTSLTSVTIPDSVTSIDWFAFYGCKKLTICGKTGSYAETYAKDNSIPFQAVSFPVTNKSSLSADSVILGKSITVNCAAKEGTAPYTYAVYYRKAGTEKWTAAQGYKENAQVKITPKAAADYEIRVFVKDASGKTARKNFTLAVKKPFANTSKLNLDTIKLGEKVKVRCFAQNGEQPYKFSVMYKKSTAQKWVVLASNSTNNIFVMKPSAAVKYDVLVTAKSPDGQTAKKTLTFTVTK